MNDAKSTKDVLVYRAKLAVASVALVGIGFIVGLYIIAPMFNKASEGYIPSAVLEMPAGTVRITNPDGAKITLPVRIADTRDAREQGLRNVGEEALETTYLLYDQERESTYGEDYNMNGVSAPLSLAVVDVNGEVVAIKMAEVGQESVDVDEDHRWVLAVKKGMLDQLGIQVASTLNPESIHEFNNET